MSSYVQRLDRSHWKGYARIPRALAEPQAQETPGRGRGEMRRDNGRNLQASCRATAERRSPAYSAEQRETMRRGLRILARVIARAHLRR